MFITLSTCFVHEFDMFVNIYQVGLATIIIFIWHNQAQKYVPNCDVSFANSELHQAYSHMTLTICAWPKYGHRSLVGCRLPRLCSYSWPPCVYGLTPWVVLFSDDLLCLRSWHRTNQWHDSLLPRDPLWLTCWFLLPNLSDLPVSMFCCWWIPVLFCAPLVSLHNSGLFLQCTYCCSYGI